MSWLTWFTWPRAALSDMQIDVLALRHAVLQIPTRINHLENLIMTTADSLAARLDAATNDIAADLTDLKDELAAALASNDADKQAAVDAALAKLDAPIARLEALGADETDPVPAPVEPAPVEPAPVDDTPPADPAA